MIVIVTPLYAGLLAVLFIALSARVILRRRDARVPVGDGDGVRVEAVPEVQSQLCSLRLTPEQP